MLILFNVKLEIVQRLPNTDHLGGVCVIFLALMMRKIQ